MQPDPKLYTRKGEILEHYRNRASESLKELTQIYGETQYKKRAREINKEIQETKGNIVTSLVQHSRKEGWDDEELLNNILMLTYCCYVVMIEYRNRVWPYEYMAFSRRIGEIWEPFCKLCFNYPVIDDLDLFVPPVFADVRRKLEQEIYDYIDQLNITDEQKEELRRYYDKVWRLVNSGAVKLELDLHFEKSEKKYVVDFKSGFGSNEKGNTNRLLLVASAYDILEEDHTCLMWVRSPEDENNQYFQILKNSGIWEAYCGEETYDQIRRYSGFNLGEWINQHIDWENDFDQETIQYFRDQDLAKYLRW